VKRTLSVLFLASLFAVSATAQSNYAVLSGTVTDPQSHAVAGAAVVLTSTTTGAIRKVLTNAVGIYEVPGLQPGDYELTVEIQNGFDVEQNFPYSRVYDRRVAMLKFTVEREWKLLMLGPLNHQFPVLVENLDPAPARAD